MSSKNQHPCDKLEKLFHEPKRLAITSALCAAASGMLFADLKSQCDLTDGNLNRHLKTLEDAEAVRVIKTNGGRRPLTRVHVTEKGRQDFMGYLLTLEQVLQQAVEAMEPASRHSPVGLELKNSLNNLIENF